jgi:hypothetical protein
MEGRTASVRTDDFRTEEKPLKHADLTQRFPLLPILFAFLNADLVDQPVDTKGGASAYIDDYFCWRAKPSAETNLKKIQSGDISRIKERARRTSLCFAAGKRTVQLEKEGDRPRQRGNHHERQSSHGVLHGKAAEYSFA